MTHGYKHKNIRWATPTNICDFSPSLHLSFHPKRFWIQTILMLTSSTQNSIPMQKSVPWEHPATSRVLALVTELPGSCDLSSALCHQQSWFLLWQLFVIHSYLPLCLINMSPFCFLHSKCPPHSCWFPLLLYPLFSCSSAQSYCEATQSLCARELTPCRFPGGQSGNLPLCPCISLSPILASLPWLILPISTLSYCCFYANLFTFYVLSLLNLNCLMAGTLSEFFKCSVIHRILNEAHCSRWAWMIIYFRYLL